MWITILLFFITTAEDAQQVPVIAEGSKPLEKTRLTSRLPTTTFI